MHSFPQTFPASLGQEQAVVSTGGETEAGGTED